MLMRKLKFTAAAAVAVLCISGFTAAAAAEETEMSITAESILVTDNIDLPDSDELFEGYVEKTFYGDYGASVYSTTARDNLSEADAKIYDALKPEIAKIANGESESAKISIDNSLLPKATFTPDELGVTSFTESTINTAKANINAEKLGFDFVEICEALMYDCPYELYWFDKTIGYGISYVISYSANSLTVKDFKFNYIVSKDYSSSGTTGTYVTSTTKTAAAKNAAANAKTVVSNNADKTDIEKLFAYKEYICGEVSYNHDAASDSYSGGYGDPWQLIYVFDNDSETNVVCEGYAKAFQYLCDLSAFSSPEIYCISVTGTMAATGETGGGHMWNVMHMDDGKNYLVDVTNSDTGTFGQDGSLFLTGYGASDGNTSYTFSNTNGSSKLTFVYDTNTTAIYSAEELALTDDIYHWDYDGDGRCDEGGCGIIIDGFGATLAGYTLSLSGNIGVNFYMELSDTILNDSGAYMQFKLPNGTTEKVMVSAAEKDTAKNPGKAYYKFPCEVAAKEMTAEITAQMFDGSGTGGAVYTYTVKDYADYIINNAISFNEKTVSLVKAMLNYGAYSQMYFNYNTGKLANATLTDNEKLLGDITEADLSSYQAALSGEGKVCTFDTAYLTLKSETSVNVYIKLSDGVSEGDVTFTVNDQSVTATKVGERYLITAANIKANSLDEKQIFKVQSSENTDILNYGALTYCRTVLLGDYSDSLKNAVKALYWYNKAADDYSAA